MSEPSSLVMQCKLSPANLRQCLLAHEPGFSAWQDSYLIHQETAEKFQAELEQKTTRATIDYLLELRKGAERPADWYCSYDPKTTTLTIAQALFSDNWLTILIFLTCLRRFGLHGAEGVIIVHDLVFGDQETVAAVQLGKNTSAIVAPESLEIDIKTFVESLVGPVRDALIAGHSEPLCDDLDSLLSSNSAS